MRNLPTLIRTGAQYVRNHPQLGMTIALVVVIPIAFLVSSQQFLNAARNNQEQLERERIGIMHDLLLQSMGKDSPTPAMLREGISYLTTRNHDIVKVFIAHAEGSGIRIIASSDPQTENTVVDTNYNFDLSRGLAGQTITAPYAEGGIRYWKGYTYYDGGGQSQYYIYTQTSLQHIDTLFARHIVYAYLWLLIILVIVLFLVFRHVRLIDYAYLYSETRKANEMKDLFTHMIAHELRAPLTTMRGYASMIRERETSDGDTKKNALEIERAAERLVGIVSDLLDIARIQSGKMDIAREPFHLSGTIRAVVEALHPSAHEKSIHIAIDDPKGTVQMKGDEKRIFQVLTNIVSNAIKYTNKGTVTISVLELRDRMEIRIKDTGMGISAHDQQKMFAPFFRVEGKETAAITGTGLGLWVTKQLIEHMGGSIGVESIKGIGTHVVITLPK